MKNKGFSLVELIVVIAIMAILVGVAVPVYTSYIGKANEAKDAQLLGEINSAFMVAAVDNNIDFSKLTSANNKVNVAEDGTITFALYDESTTDTVDLNADVIAILGNDLKFSVIDAIIYNVEKRQFVGLAEGEYAYGGGVIKLDPEDIAVLKGSVFGDIGMSDLLDKVGYATGLVSNVELLVRDDGSYTALGNLVMSGTGPLQAYLGFDPDDESDDEAFEAAYEALVMRRATILANGGEITDEIVEQAGLDILANNTVLVAATTTDFDTDELVGVLGSEQGGIKDVLKNTEDPQVAVAKTAMAYALYTAYMEKTNQEVSDDPADVLNTLETDEFKAYINEPDTENDIEGYLAAMNMIEDSSKDKDAVSELLVNGFSDEKLKDVLNSAVGE